MARKLQQAKLNLEQLKTLRALVFKAALKWEEMHETELAEEYRLILVQLDKAGETQVLYVG